MSARRLLSLAAALALASPGPARAQELNVITAVELQDQGSSVVLSVKGSRPPNFTTFSMADPPRFVIDLSESRFEGVPEDLVVQDGVVNVVKNLSYGSDATSIARVMVAFMVEVEPPDVQTSGTTLVVRVQKPGAAAVAAAPAEPAPAEAAPVEPAPAEAAPVAAQPDPVAEAARAEAERLAAAQAEAERQAAAQAEAERQAAAAKAEEERRAQAEAQAQLEARAQADAEARARYEAEQRAAAEQRAREEAQAQAAAPAPAAEAAPAEPLAAAPPPPPPAPEAEAEAPAMPPSSERLDAGAPAARLRQIGFRELPNASRVFVRTSVTPRFTIQEAGENTIRVELENTRVARRNDTRFMDTSFFPGAVALVTPSRRGSTYVVEIKLKQRVPFQQRIEGDMLAIDFERPPAPAPEADAEAVPAEGEPAPAEGEPAPAPGN